MSRLSKEQIKLHRHALDLLEQPKLSDDDREFVLRNWAESANHINSAAGAFFTPVELAPSVVLYASGADTIVDLCAGIGCLGLSAWWYSGRRAQVTCVEVNPDYVAVGRKVFPEAEWICADVRAAGDIGAFDCAIANPPFGKMAKIATARYAGEDDLAVVDIASDIARWGVFILPSMSVPFEYSGRPGYSARPSAKYDKFTDATGIKLSCESTDTAFARSLWRGVAPHVEVASADFGDVRAARAARDACASADAQRQGSLFAEVAA